MLATITFAMLISTASAPADTRQPIDSNTRQVDYVVLANASVVFDCVVDLTASVRWDHKSSAGSIDTTLYNDNRVNRHAKNVSPIDVEPIHNISVSRLTMPVVRSTDAGTYNCINTGTGKIRLEAELTVLAEQPRCSINASDAVDDKTHVTVTCVVLSYGRAEPSVNCSNTRRVNPASAPKRGQGGRGESSWTSVAGKEMHNSQFVCRVTLGNNGSQAAYGYLWESPNITVLYGPVSTTIEVLGNETVMTNGSRLLCSADANPAATYQWLTKSQFGTQVHHGPEFVVDVCSLIGVQPTVENETLVVELTCIASRGGHTHSTLRQVFVDVRQRCPIGAPAAVSVTQWIMTTAGGGLLGGAASLVVVIVIIIIVVVVVVKRGRRSEDTMPTKRAGLYTPNHPLRDDAHGDADHYDDLPQGYSALSRNVYGPYEEIPIGEVQQVDGNTGVPEDAGSQPLPYQKLSSEQRGPPAMPAVYRQLTDAPDSATTTRPYIDIIHASEDAPMPYLRLDPDKRRPPPAPPVYKKLKKSKMVAADDGRAHDYIVVADDRPEVESRNDDGEV